MPTKPATAWTMTATARSTRATRAVEGPATRGCLACAPAANWPARAAACSAIRRHRPGTRSATAWTTTATARSTRATRAVEGPATRGCLACAPAASWPARAAACSAIRRHRPGTRSATAWTTTATARSTRATRAVEGPATRGCLACAPAASWPARAAACSAIRRHRPGTRSATAWTTTATGRWMKVSAIAFDSGSDITTVHSPERDFMNRIMAIELIVIGAGLLYYAYQSSQGLDDQLSQTLTGNITDETVYYFIGGGIALVVGLVMLRRK